MKIHICVKSTGSSASIYTMIRSSAEDLTILSDIYALKQIFTEYSFYC